MNAYTIDHATKTIFCTRKFYERSAQLNTPECNKCKQLRASFPDYAIAIREIKRNENKRVPNKNLTYANMVRYIAVQPDGVENLVEFATIRNLSNQKGYIYPAVKRWFMEHYPAYLVPSVSEQELKSVERFVSMEAARQMLDDFSNCETVEEIRDVVLTHLPNVDTKGAVLSLEQAS